MNYKKIKVNATTCQICGGYANWDTSWGRESFIVCDKCFKRLCEVNEDNALGIVLAIGFMREGF